MYDQLEYFLLAVMPYLTLLAFVAGIAYRPYRWKRATPATVRLLLHQAPKGTFRSTLSLLRETLFMPSLTRASWALWLSVWTFHVAFLFTLFGHGRLIAEFNFLWGPLNIGLPEVQFLSDTLGIAVGVLLLITSIYLLAHRSRGLISEMSVFEDYFALALILGVIIAGDYVRLFSHLTLPPINGVGFLLLSASSPFIVVPP